MNSRQGFSLIECIIYIGLSSMLSLCILQFVVAMRVQLKNNAILHEQLMSMYGAVDLIAQDLFLAQASVETWKVAQDNCYIWSAKNQDVCWHVQQRVLYKITGMYNQKQKTWQGKHTAKVAQSIDSLAVSKRENNIMHITVKTTINGQVRTVERTVSCLG